MKAYEGTSNRRLRQMLREPPVERDPKKRAAIIAELKARRKQATR